MSEPAVNGAPGGLSSRRVLSEVASGESRAALAIADRIAAREDELARRVVERCREEIADYRLIEDDEVLADVLGFALENLDVLIADLRHGQRATPSGLEPARAAGRRRFHQRVSLESLLHGLRVWARVALDAVLEEVATRRPGETEAALMIASRLLTHLDLISAAATDSYLDESNERGLLRRDLLDALVTGRADTKICRLRAGALGVQLAENYVELVFRPGGVRSERGPRQSTAARLSLDRIVYAARSFLRPGAGMLIVGMRHGDVVALYPVTSAAGVPAIRRECAALVDSLTEPVAVGLSAWHPGLAAVASGYREALDAVDIAASRGIFGRPVALDDVLVDHIFRSSASVDRILAEALRPVVEYDRTHHASLLTTLHAFLDSGLNVTQTARTCYVHPNTVEYRLRRIRELSGHNPRNPDDLLILSLAIRFDEVRSAGGVERSAA
jgi:PucR C-terminal helix-turn-helix domain/GGDEF-like domain